MSFKLPHCRTKQKKNKKRRSTYIICLKLRKEIVKATEAHTV